jgi:predicted protein tyrosine phosphatase
MSDKELQELNEKIKNRQFETSELEIIRYVLKTYANLMLEKDDIKNAAIITVWHKVKKLHLQQKKEDKELLENW